MASLKIAAAIEDPDEPEPIPIQVNWLDDEPAIAQRSDGRWQCVFVARWTRCQSGFVVPDVPSGRGTCPTGWAKPAVHISRVFLHSANQATVAAAAAAMPSKPRDYFTSEGSHFVNLEA